jgi:hypothetical protein
MIVDRREEDPLDYRERAVSGPGAAERSSARHAGKVVVEGPEALRHVPVEVILCGKILATRAIVGGLPLIHQPGEAWLCHAGSTAWAC